MIQTTYKVMATYIDPAIMVLLFLIILIFLIITMRLKQRIDELEKKGMLEKDNPAIVMPETNKKQEEQKNGTKLGKDSENAIEIE